MNDIGNEQDFIADIGADLASVLREKLADAQVPGYWAEFAPDEADLAGAFVEEALAESDAAVTHVDLISPDTNDAKEHDHE